MPRFKLQTASKYFVYLNDSLYAAYCSLNLSCAASQRLPWCFSPSASSPVSPRIDHVGLGSAFHDDPEGMWKVSLTWQLVLNTSFPPHPPRPFLCRGIMYMLCFIVRMDFSIKYGFQCFAILSLGHWESSLTPLNLNFTNYKKRIIPLLSVSSLKLNENIWNLRIVGAQ